MTTERIETRDYDIAGLRFRLSQVGRGLRCQAITTADAPVRADVDRSALWERVPVLVHVRGRERWGHYGARALHTEPSMSLELEQLEVEGNVTTGALVIRLRDPATALLITLRYQAYGQAGAVRATAEAVNQGNAPVTLEQFLIAFPGLGRPDNARWGETATIHTAGNCWIGEAQWRAQRPSELGIADTRAPSARLADLRPSYADPLGAAVWRNTGTWTTANHLPMGVIEDRDAGLSWFWQIEHSGSWQAEVGRAGHAFYVAAGLPSLRHGDWAVTLAPGEAYAAAPLGFGCARGGFAEAIAALTRYRRAACAPKSPADRGRPLIFNDYLLCLQANPLVENTLPMIETAAEAGAEYYVIDAGWFDPRGGPQCLGDWQESGDRFGDLGLAGICDRIRARGMQPGLWAEIECVSEAAMLAGKPDHWFVCTDGHRVRSNGRLFLNFASPEVRAYAQAVIDRLRRDYGIKYLKLDYNADAGLGDNQLTASRGAGQVASTRGFFDWLEEVGARHPDLIIENCASGGMRLDYGLLARTHVQSITDQEDYRRYPSIVTGVLAAGLPEQMCVWSFPQGGQDDEAVCMNLVAPMLARWHLSGRIDQLTASQRVVVRQATDLWKRFVRGVTSEMVPFWPLPFRHLHETDRWIAAGLRSVVGDHAFVTLFRLDADEEVVLPLGELLGEDGKVAVLFPTHLPTRLERLGAGMLRVALPQPWSARLIEIRRQ
jgi:alpha-galactosidase